MEAIGADPIQFGLRVRSHPSLTVTSRAKMRHGTELRVSFAGDVSETTVFSTDRRILEQNRFAVEDFLGRLGADGIRHVPDPRQDRTGGRAHRWQGSHMWAGVPPEHILSFLGLFSTHEDAARANAPVLAKYIRQQVQHGELIDWTVLLVGGDGADRATFGSWSVDSVVRQPKGGYGDPANPRVIQAGERFVIRRLLNPRDEAVDLGPDAYHAAMAATRSPIHPSEDAAPTGRHDHLRACTCESSGPRARAFFFSIRSPADRASRTRTGRSIMCFFRSNLAPVGLGISFPDTGNAESVSYVVNSIYSDTDDDGDA